MLHNRSLLKTTTYSVQMSKIKLITSRGECEGLIALVSEPSFTLTGVLKPCRSLLVRIVRINFSIYVTNFINQMLLNRFGRCIQPVIRSDREISSWLCTEADVYTRGRYLFTSKCYIVGSGREIVGLLYTTDSQIRSV